MMMRMMMLMLMLKAQINCPPKESVIVAAQERPHTRQVTGHYGLAEVRYGGAVSKHCIIHIKYEVCTVCIVCTICIICTPRTVNSMSTYSITLSGWHPPQGL